MDRRDSDASRTRSPCLGDRCRATFRSLREVSSRLYTHSVVPSYLARISVSTIRFGLGCCRIATAVLVEWEAEVAESNEIEYEISATAIEAFIGLHGLVPIPPELMPRVLRGVHEHREAMRRFAAAGIELRDVFPSQVYKVMRSEP